MSLTTTGSSSNLGGDDDDNIKQQQQPHINDDHGGDDDNNNDNNNNNNNNDNNNNNNNNNRKDVIIMDVIVDHSRDNFITKVKQFIKFLGPAVLVSVGYVDPGNWATDIEGGSTFGYSLLWVLLVSNILAIILQTLSARMGLVTRRDLAQQCANFYPPAISILLWVLAELAIAATDLAEVLGTAIGLKLLFKIPLIWGVLITACDTLVFLLLDKLGHRFTESIILVLMSIISVCFVIEMIISKPSPKGIVLGALIPSLPKGSLPVVTGILGATIMPHNLYLHSGLILSRASNDRTLTQRFCKFALIDALLSLNMALFVNASILIVSCASFFEKKKQQVTAIEDAHSMLESLFGKAASIVFGIALLLSGQSSTICGTLAGQMVMEGFLQFQMTRPWLRRLVTRLLAIAPAVLVILIFGEKNGTSLLVWSQVILSIQLPFAMIPLIRITSHQEMGDYRNGLPVWIIGWCCVTFVVGLNMWLVVDAFRTYFNNESSSVAIWVLAIVGCVVFLSLLIYIATCRIEPKQSSKDFIILDNNNNNNTINDMNLEEDEEDEEDEKDFKKDDQVLDKTNNDIDLDLEGGDFNEMRRRGSGDKRDSIEMETNTIEKITIEKE